MESVFCPKDGASYLILSDQVPFLLYYSHLPAIILSLLFGIFLYLQAQRSISSVIILLISVLYSFRSFFDLITWATNDSRQVMFFWSLQIYFELAIYVAFAYLVYVFLHRQDMPLLRKVIFFSPLAILAIFLPTTYTLSYMVLDEFCEASEGIMAVNYVYAVEITIITWLIIHFIYHFLKTKDEKSRKQLAIFALGSTIFLVGFSWGNITGSLSENWEIAQYGEFGMPVFIALLAYLVVKYRTFNAKLLSVQALSFSLVTLVGSLLFFIREPVPYFIVGITLILLIVLARVLVLSVQKEVKRKEELEILSKELALANTELKRLDESKSEFISIASHQLRTPLTAIRGFLALLVEGAYGKLEPKIEQTIQKVTVANNRLMNLVENLLNISRIEAGRIQYQFSPTHIEDIVSELEDMFLLAAQEKGIKFKVEKLAQPLPLLSLDAAKIREVISNMIDNAMKYTQEGSVTVSYERHPECVAIVVADTGMGIDPKDLPHLFKKFERGSQAERVNVSSTGLGLFVGRKFAEAHGGTITAHSEGKGKGAKFILELPIHVVEKAKQLSRA